MGAGGEIRHISQGDDSSQSCSMGAMTVILIINEAFFIRMFIFSTAGLSNAGVAKANSNQQPASLTTNNAILGTLSVY